MHIFFQLIINTHYNNSNYIFGWEKLLSIVFVLLWTIPNVLNNNND